MFKGQIFSEKSRLSVWKKQSQHWRMWRVVKRMALLWISWSLSRLSWWQSGHHFGEMTWGFWQVLKTRSQSYEEVWTRRKTHFFLPRNVCWRKIGITRRFKWWQCPRESVTVIIFSLEDTWMCRADDEATSGLLDNRRQPRWMLLWMDKKEHCTCLGCLALFDFLLHDVFHLEGN